MYVPVGDRVLVTKHAITKEVKTLHGIILPEGYRHDTDPPDLLRVEAIGVGPGCDLLKVGDMVLIIPGGLSFQVYISKEEQLKYYIVNATSIIGRARMIRDEVDVEDQPDDKPDKGVA